MRWGVKVMKKKMGVCGNQLQSSSGGFKWVGKKKYQKINNKLASRKRD